MSLNDKNKYDKEKGDCELRLQRSLTINDNDIDHNTPELQVCESSESSESSTIETLNLLDLPWEQVVSNYLLPYLSIRDLFRLRAVSSGFRDLIQTHFDLQFHVNTSSLGDHFTSQAFQIMTKNCILLKSICVRGAKSWLNSETLMPVIGSNPRLEKIDLTGCSALSGATVYYIGVNCNNIRHLSLKDCVWLNGDNFLSFMNKKRCLEFLDISGCWNLDDELVIQLVQFTPSIKCLFLANLYGLTDRAVGAVAHCCPNLVHLSLRGCWRVTDCSVKLISHYCPKLNALQVKECRDVTEESLGYLRSRKVRIDKPPPPGSNLHRLEHLVNNPSPRINMVL